ncbi:MAG: hypothetical protein JW795_00930 [Chitinivibrionales bacterium]|nr:hypothetical protein [Chitinivibrionales bacterium]
MQIMVVDEEGNSVIFKRMDREMVTVEKEKSWQVVTNFFQFGEDPAAFEKMCNRYTDP